MGNVFFLTNFRAASAELSISQGDGGIHHCESQGGIESPPNVDEQNLLQVMHKLAIDLGIRDRDSIRRPVHKRWNVNAENPGDF